MDKVDIEVFNNFDDWTNILIKNKPKAKTIFHEMENLYKIFNTRYVIVKYNNQPILGVPFIIKTKSKFINVLDSHIYTLPFLGFVIFDEEFLLKNNLEFKECVKKFTYRIISSNLISVIRIINPTYFKDIRSFLWNSWIVEISYTYVTQPNLIDSILGVKTRKYIRRARRYNPQIDFGVRIDNSLIEEYIIFSKRKNFFQMNLKDIVTEVILHCQKLGYLRYISVHDNKDYSCEIFIIDPYLRVAYRMYAFSSDQALKKNYDYLALYEIIKTFNNIVDKIYLLAAPSLRLSIFTSKFAFNIEPYFWLIYRKPSIPLSFIKRIGIQTCPYL